MGMFDTLVYDCPNCSEETNSQTKLGDCMLDALKIGDPFLEDNKSMIMEMKDTCEHCDSYNAVCIINGRITGFTDSSSANYKEGSWGSCNKIKI